MKEAFQKVAQVYEKIKKSVQEKLEDFNKKFELVRTETSKEILGAKSPDDLINLGKKMQADGEALKLEQESVNQEKSQGEDLEKEKNEMIKNDHEEALAENESFDQQKAAEKAEAERVSSEKAANEKAEAEQKAATEKAQHEAYVKKQETDEQAKLAELRAKLGGEQQSVAEVVETPEGGGKNNFDLEKWHNKEVTVQRSNGGIEKGWFVSSNNDRGVFVFKSAEGGGYLQKNIPFEQFNALNTEDSAVENVDSSAEVTEKPGVEELTEKIGASESAMFEKYGSKMRQAADELVEVANAMREINRNMEMAGSDDERKEIWKGHKSLNDRRNELLDDATWGGSVLDRATQKAGETFTEASDRRSNEHKKYQEAAMDDPYVVLRLVEAGQLGSSAASGDGLEKVSKRLCGNSEFIQAIIDTVSKNETQKSYSTGWFWKNVSGEARGNKDLYVKAVQLNPLNYQYGSNEWKADPVVQKAALESGLDPSYLYRGN
jgi:hypothetical protein